MTIIKFLLLLGLIFLTGSGSFQESPKTETTQMDGWMEAYVDKMTECMQEDPESSFELIYVDDDDIPELAAGRQGFYLSVFSYGPKGITTIVDQCVYGAMGIAGYEYSPRDNVMRVYDADFAGQIRWLDYWMIGEDKERKEFYEQALCCSNYNEIYEMSDGIEFNEETLYYFYGEEMITPEEYDSYLIDGDYRYIELGKSYEEIMDELTELRKE
ncbi:MAG: hypothetical protein ACI4AQ_00220 [Lachnospiraceae bacterium]